MPSAALTPLPLPLEVLPASVHRFCDPSTPARAMAAKGLVPLKGAELLTVLAQLTADADAAISQTAKNTLSKLPEPIAAGALSGDLHPSILDALADAFSTSVALSSELVSHPAVHPSTVVRLARTSGDPVCERIAANEERVLAHPEIVEALYNNPKARMSTIDRLIDLCARRGVRVEGIAAFDEHAKALEGELIAEPTAEPIPDDVLFSDALTVDGEEDAIERDPIDGTEKIKDAKMPLWAKIRDMTAAQKIRLAMVGSASARALLVRDKDKAVARAAVTSPRMTESEAAAVALSREVSEDVLREIGRRRDWHAHYPLKAALVRNPKTPLAIAMTFLTHLHEADLRTLSKSRGVPQAVKTAAAQRVMKGEKKG